MGVERQTIKINWITSLGLVVLAGSFYRFRKIIHNLTSAQVRNILIKYGFHNIPRDTQLFVGRPLKK